MAKQEVKIKKDEQNPEPIELIADSIIQISSAFKKMRDSRLKERAIILLIKDKCNLGISEIQQVLQIAANLDIYYIKELPKSKQP